MAYTLEKRAELMPLKTGGSIPWKLPDYQLTREQILSNNTLVKKSGVQLTLSFSHLLELDKCANDPIYFIENYCRIISVDHGIIPFILYDYQKEVLDMYHENRFSVSLQSRQSGKTATSAAYILWYTIFNDAKQVAVLANKLEQSEEIMERITQMLEELPYWLQPGCEYVNKRSIEFQNKSKIFGSASGSDAIRGRSLAILYWDEAAFTAHDDEFYTSVFPVISSGHTTKIIITSTPKGARGTFYRLYKDAEREENGFAHLCVKWNRVPGRTQEWAEDTISKIGQTQFNQEFECSFIGSSNTLIPSTVLETLRWEQTINDDTFLHIYKEPEEKVKYIAIVDPAAGVGEDYSVCTVIRVSDIPYEVVAVYRNNEISPLLFPYTVKSICDKYNSCPVLIENNNDIGGIVSVSMYYDLEYENVILCNSDQNRYGVRIGGFSKAFPGIKTTSKVKQQGCANLKTLLELEKLILNDYDIINELGTFISVGKSYEADEGCHDDTVMTLVLFSYLIKMDWFIDYTSNNTQAHMFDYTREKNKHNMLPFGYVSNPYTSVVEPIGMLNIQVPVVDGVERQMSFEEWMNN